MTALTLGGSLLLAGILAVGGTWGSLRMSRSRRAAAESLERMASVLDSTTDAIIETRFDWRMVYFNSRARALLPGGCDLVGRSVWEAFPELVGTETEGRIRAAMEQRVEAEFDVLGPRTGRWFSVRLYPSRAGLVCCLRDVTARKAMEQALLDTEHRLRLAVRSARAGLWEWDAVRDTVYWSEENYRIHGLEPSAGEIRTEGWLDLMRPDDREYARRHLREAVEMRKEAYDYEYRVALSDGRVRWIQEIGRIHYDDADRLLGMNGLSVDITDRKQLEADLRAAKDDAERATLAKARFLAAASHDLRQPLQSMSLFTGALHAHLADRRGAEILSMVERGIDTLRALLDSLLDVSRLDANAVAPDVQDFDLEGLLQEICLGYASLAACKGLELVSGKECDDVRVRSDRTLLGRMIRNLLENAVRYTERGRITVSCRLDGPVARIEVSDTGIGIPAEHMDLIFEEFHQVGNPGRDRSRGLGLGLSIVQRLSQVLGHEVRVRSELGAGSTFSIGVPLATAGGEHGRRAEKQGAAEPAVDCRGRVVLLIDDDTIVLSGLREVFDQWGCKTLVAHCCDEALAELERSGQMPDIIVADYRLGDGESGPDVISRVRDTLGRNVPGMILTGETGGRAMEIAAGDGLQVLHKPVTPGQLGARIEAMLRGGGNG